MQIWIKCREKLKTSKKFRVRFLLVCAAVLLLLGASVFTLFIKPHLSEEKYIYKEATVEYGNMVLGIVESGSVSLEEASVNYELELTEEDDDEEDDDDSEDDEEETIHYLTIEDVYVAAGQRIQEGDPMFLLSQESLEAVRKRLTAKLTEAQITLAQAQSEYDVSVLSAKGDYQMSVNEAANAGALKQATLSSLQAEIDGYTADIAVLQEEIVMAGEDLQDEDLYTDRSDAYNSFVSAQNKLNDTDVTNVDAYTANYESYTKAKDTFDKADDAINDLMDSIEDKQEELAKKQEALQKASENLEQKKREAKQTYDTSVSNGELAEDVLNYTEGTLQETVQEAQTALEDATELLQDFETFVGSEGVIYADGTGLVTAVNYEAGDELTTTGTMASYVTEDSYSVSIDVSEEDVPALTVGDQVEISMAAYEDTVYTGTITEISTTAASTHATTVSYPVTVHIEGDTSALYGGMTADVTFVTDETDEVLYVSRKAIVRDEEDKAYVYQKSPGGYTLTSVETGFTDGTNIEITKGLAKGDTIYIQSKITGNESELRSAKSDATDTAPADADTGSTEMPEGMPESMSEGMPEEMPEGMPGDLPQGMNGSMQ